MNSIALLKPGGIAVHTFEFTLSSVRSLTQRHGETSLWTQADVEGLARDLCSLGYEVLPLRCAAGGGAWPSQGDASPRPGCQLAVGPAIAPCSMRRRWRGAASRRMSPRRRPPLPIAP